MKPIIAPRRTSRPSPCSSAARSRRSCRGLFFLQHARVARIGPVDPDIPDAALVGSIEFDTDAAAVPQHAAELIVRPVIVARIVESQELDAIARAVDDVDVALVRRPVVVAAASNKPRRVPLCPALHSLVRECRMANLRIKVALTASSPGEDKLKGCHQGASPKTMN